MILATEMLVKSYAGILCHLIMIKINSKASEVTTLDNTDNDLIGR